MNLLHDGEIEGIQEPAGVGDLNNQSEISNVCINQSEISIVCINQYRIYLIVGEDPINVKLSIWSKAKTLFTAGDDSSHEGTVTQTILQCFLIGPVGSLLDPPEVRMTLAEASVKYCHPDQ